MLFTDASCDPEWRDVLTERCGTRCFAQDEMCDGSWDCSNGADEKCGAKPVTPTTPRPTGTCSHSYCWLSFRIPADGWNRVNTIKLF